MVAEANEMGLNIQYPYEIDWLPEEGKPIGLFAVIGWIEERVEVMKEQQDEMERKAKGYTEVHTSDMTDEETDGNE